MNRRAVFFVVTAASVAGACVGPESEAGPENGAEQNVTRSVSLGGCGVEVPDTVASVFDASKDPFKELILKAGPCPQVDGRPLKDSRAKANSQIPAVMKALSERGCTRLGRSLVSEKGMYRSATTEAVGADDPANFKISGLSPRFVETWQCGGSDVRQKIFIAGPEAAFHVISFDPVAKAFNFYSTNPGARNEAFVFHGNSFQQAKETEIPVRKAPFPDHACTTCHTNGGLLLKELRFPWLNWQATSGVGASQLRDAAGMNTLVGGGDARNVRIVEELERDVLQSQIAVNESRVTRLVEGGPADLNATASVSAPYTLKTLLAPLFCETEINIATSPTQLELDAAGLPKAGSTRPIAIPPDLFMSRLLVPINGTISFASGGSPSRLDTTGNDDNQDFGARSAAVTVPQSQWLSTMKGLGVGVPADKTSSLSARRPGAFGDGIFPMPVAARAFANDDFVARLVSRGVIEDKLAADVLMVDFPNPVFSKVRCDLLKAIPEVPAKGLSAAAITEKVLASIDGSAGTSPGAVELRANRARTLAQHGVAVDTFMTKCQASLPTKLVDLYVLTTARRANLFEDLRTPTKDFPSFAVEGFVRDQFFPVDVSVRPEMSLSRALSQECTIITR